MVSSLRHLKWLLNCFLWELTQLSAAPRFRDIRFQKMEIENTIVTPDIVLWSIMSFKPYKSPGSDEIFPVMLKKSWHLIGDLLLLIFKSSLSLGYIPKSLQRVRVVFIPKPGKDDYTIPKSFRSISLTSFFSKSGGETDREIHQGFYICQLSHLG